MGQFSHDQPVCASVYYSHNCSFIVFSYYGVHFQVTEPSAICLLRPFMDTCAVGYLYAGISDQSTSMFQMVLTVLVHVSTISLVTPYHLVYSLMRDILAFQCQTARYLPGRPLFSNKQRDNLGLYPCFHCVIAGMSVLVVCGIRLSRIPVVFAAAAAVTL